MGGLRSVLRPLNRQLRQHVEDVTLPRLDHLSGQIEEVRAATLEVRRLVTDDLDASNEASALLGRALVGLTDAVQELRGEVAELRARVEDQGPSGPSERGTQGPSGPSERGTQGPSGPSERGDRGPSGPSERGDRGPSGPSERGDQGPSGPGPGEPGR